MDSDRGLDSGLLPCSMNRRSFRNRLTLTWCTPSNRKRCMMPECMNRPPLRRIIQS